METGIKISAIIPTHNRCNLLGDTIESLKNQNLPDDEYEIIVVDNASTDNTKGVVQEYNLKGGEEIHYVYEEHLGLHNARHAGARRARGEILAYTDDDAIYDSNWLNSLLRFYDDSKVGCVGGRILPKWEATPPEWINQFPKGFLSLLDLGNEPKELNTPGIYGVNFSIRRDLLFRLGGFNPESFGGIWLGDGETGLLRKVKKGGYKIIYTPDAICWHLVPKERLTIEYIKRRSANEGACASYSAYKEKRYGKIILLGRSFALILYVIFHDMMSRTSKIVDSPRWVYHEWRKSYGISRLKYELKLIYDRHLRELVLREDWIINTSKGIGDEITEGH